MGDHFTLEVTPTSPIHKKFNTSNITTCAGTLRILIVVVGIISIILSSIGSPSDRKSRNGQSGSGNTQDEFYGYGLGYDYEPLNVVFLACLILAWIFALAFLMVLGFEGSHGYMMLNRFLYCLFGLIILVGVGCGTVGTYYFWRGCCNIGPSTDPARLYLTRQEGYSSRGRTDGPWCRCTFRYGASGIEGSPTYREAFQYPDSTLYHIGQVTSAWPHHFVTHCIGMALAFVDCILYFIAACIA